MVSTHFVYDNLEAKRQTGMSFQTVRKKTRGEQRPENTSRFLSSTWQRLRKYDVVSPLSPLTNEPISMNHFLSAERKQFNTPSIGVHYYFQCFIHVCSSLAERGLVQRCRVGSGSGSHVVCLITVINKVIVARFFGNRGRGLRDLDVL